MDDCWKCHCRKYSPGVVDWWGCKNCSMDCLPQTIGWRDIKKGKKKEGEGVFVAYSEVRKYELGVKE